MATDDYRISFLQSFIISLRRKKTTQYVILDYEM